MYSCMKCDCVWSTKKKREKSFKQRVVPGGVAYRILLFWLTYVSYGLVKVVILNCCSGINLLKLLSSCIWFGCLVNLVVVRCVMARLCKIRIVCNDICIVAKKKVR
jgi:hypothetical protein